MITSGIYLIDTSGFFLDFDKGAVLFVVLNFIQPEMGGPIG